MPASIAIAVSGGIDSLVAAGRLQAAGHRVVGIHFLTGHEGRGDLGPAGGAPLAPDARPPDGGRRVAAHISNQLRMPVEILDLRREFEKEIVAYFAASYRRGLTPNPCVVCNERIKFGRVLDFARRLGAEALATGHYARIRLDDDGRPHLMRGVDILKDQSYFLARLDRRQLSRARFPLGDMTKAAVRQWAAEKSLHPAHVSESQDVCFIRGDYGGFLSRREGFESLPGEVVDVRGRVIGRHAGLYRFTVGQRRGIGIPAAEPYYVVRIEPQTNRLVVGFQRHLFNAGFRAADINWLGPVPEAAMDIEVRVRYRSPATVARLTPHSERRAEVRFRHPQAAVTPGQAAVFYRRQEVLGAGWIQPPAAAPQNPQAV